MSDTPWWIIPLPSDSRFSKIFLYKTISPFLLDNYCKICLSILQMPPPTHHSLADSDNFLIKLIWIVHSPWQVSVCHYFPLITNHQNHQSQRHPSGQWENLAKKPVSACIVRGVCCIKNSAPVMCGFSGHDNVRMKTYITGTLFFYSALHPTIQAGAGFF